MPKIHVKKSGKWADPEPHVPQIEVEAGKEYNVSPGLADVMVKAGCAEYVQEKEKAPTQTQTKRTGKSPAQADKEAADKGKADA